AGRHRVVVDTARPRDGLDGRSSGRELEEHPPGDEVQDRRERHRAPSPERRRRAARPPGGRVGRRLIQIPPQVYFETRAQALAYLSPARKGPVMVGKEGAVSEVWVWDTALGEPVLLGPGLYDLASIFALTGWSGARISLLSA